MRLLIFKFLSWSNWEMLIQIQQHCRWFKLVLSVKKKKRSFLHFCVWNLILLQHLFFLTAGLFYLLNSFIVLHPFNNLLFPCGLNPLLLYFFATPCFHLFCYYTLCDSSPGLAGRATFSPGWCCHRGWAASSGPPCWQGWQPPSWAGCGRSDPSAQSRWQRWRQCGSLLLSELLHLSQVGEGIGREEDCHTETACQVNQEDYSSGTRWGKRKTWRLTNDSIPSR